MFHIYKLLKQTFLGVFNLLEKELLEHLFNVVIILYTDFNLKLSFKPKIDPKTCTFKPWKKYLKNFWQP